MHFSTEQLLNILLREFNTHKTTAVVLFCIISLGILSIGLVWPKKFTAYTTIIIDRQNIIQPLLEGAAVSTKIQNRLRLAKEIIFSQKIMHQLLLKTGLITSATGALYEERLSQIIKKNTTVTKVGKTLIRISYQDSDPEKVYNITKALADLFIQESVRTQAVESQAAFKFIEKQVGEYHKKLVDAEENLKNLRSSNADARPGTEVAVNEQIAVYRRQINASRLELREAKIKRKSLESQLSGEAEITLTVSREGQFRNRISNLQTQLDILRLSYQEEHPDIIRTKRQIEDIKKTIIEEAKRRKEARESAKGTGNLFVEEGVLLSPLYQELRSQLSLTKTKIATLKARISETGKLMEEEYERLKRINNTEAILAELTRDYEVNRDMYSSLLTRKEKANISMNLGRESSGPSFNIQEPARLPLVPSGLRFLHFLITGILLGISIPVGLIYALIKLDPRVRMSALIEEKLSIPVLATIPHIYDNVELKRNKFRNLLLITMICGVAVVYVTMVVVKFMKVVP